MLIFANQLDRVLEFVLVLILFLLSYFLKLLRFLGVIWCLKKDYHTTNYVNKLAENRKSLAAENILVSFVKFKLQEQAKNHSVTQSVLSSIFPRDWSSFMKKRWQKNNKTRSDSSNHLNLWGSRGIFSFPSHFQIRKESLDFHGSDFFFNFQPAS